MLEKRESSFLIATIFTLPIPFPPPSPLISSRHALLRQRNRRQDRQDWLCTAITTKRNTRKKYSDKQVNWSLIGKSIWIKNKYRTTSNLIGLWTENLSSLEQMLRNKQFNWSLNGKSIKSRTNAMPADKLFMYSKQFSSKSQGMCKSRRKKSPMW